MMNSKMECTVEDMVLAREHRAEVQQTLREKYHSTVLSFSLNIPGPIKLSEKYEKCFLRAVRDIRALLSAYDLSVRYEAQESPKTGCSFFAVIDGEARDVKNCLLPLEEERPVGRIYDIDVISPEGRKISREGLGYPLRKCLCCEETAMVCARSRRHSVPEMLEKIDLLLEEETKVSYGCRTNLMADP